MYLLSIESSCDETACAIVKDGRQVLSNIIASQVKEHQKYGGVVPEIASRRHVENISQVCELALSEANLTMAEITGIAATYAPGLIGALLVGFNFAKGLALSHDKPFIPVHHIKGHIAANYITHPQLSPPFLCLVVSGGHSHLVEVLSYTTYKVWGKTLDDAAGEAFDKVARALNLPYPGGVHMNSMASGGNPKAYAFPTPKVPLPYHFSFSGLKTAALNLINQAKQKQEPLSIPDFCASFQHKMIEILSSATMDLAKELGYTQIALAGGVSANSVLRETMEHLCQAKGYSLYLPTFDLCGDNAAMIGTQGYYEYLGGNVSGLDLNAIATLPIDLK